MLRRIAVCGPEGLDGFELEAAYLRHHEVRLPAGEHVVDEGLPDIAPTKTPFGEAAFKSRPRSVVVVVLPFVPVTAMIRSSMKHDASSISPMTFAPFCLAS